MIKELIHYPLRTQFGTFEEYLFYDGKQEAIALTMGSIEDQEAVLCRVHSSCLGAHAFNSVECDCRKQMAAAQRMIQEASRGIIIWLEQEGKGNGHYALLKSKAFKEQGMPQAEAYRAAGFREDARDFQIAAKVLEHLKVRSVLMITGNPEKTTTLSQFGIEVVGTCPT